MSNVPWALQGIYLHDSFHFFFVCDLAYCFENLFGMQMNVIKVSNIMGIESKPFDPKTYEEEDVFVTDETGDKKRIRLEDNIVRWRSVKNRNGTVSVCKVQFYLQVAFLHCHLTFNLFSSFFLKYESNARFVKWKDGSLQLLIGNEVLDISVHESTHDQSHLFLRHGKVNFLPFVFLFLLFSTVRL